MSLTFFPNIYCPPYFTPTLLITTIFEFARLAVRTQSYTFALFFSSHVQLNPSYMNLGITNLRLKSLIFTPL